MRSIFLHFWSRDEISVPILLLRQHGHRWLSLTSKQNTTSKQTQQNPSKQTPQKLNIPPSSDSTYFVEDILHNLSTVNCTQTALFSVLTTTCPSSDPNSSALLTKLKIYSTARTDSTVILITKVWITEMFLVNDKLKAKNRVSSASVHLYQTLWTALGCLGCRITKHCLQLICRGISGLSYPIFN